MEFFKRVICKAALIIPLITVFTSQECFFTHDCINIYNNGSSYRGTMNRTHYGQYCIQWNAHPFDVTPSNYPTEGLISNFCRNPRGSGMRPWCYTDTNSSHATFWGYCDVPKCDKCLINGIHMKEGDIFHNNCAECSCTPYGIKCYTCPDLTSNKPRVGCYPKEDIHARFPGCCRRQICHDTNPDEFDFHQYTEYMKKIFDQ